MGIIDEMSVSSFGMKFTWMLYAFDFVDAVLFFIELAEFLIVRPLILLIYYIIHNQINRKFNKFPNK